MVRDALGDSSARTLAGEQPARSWPRRLALACGLIALCLALHVPGIAELPVVDRDEARFAQASKQMLESGDWIDIRFQDEPRHKKPVGIYWLQSASAALLGKQAIGAYRLPSLLGAIAAVLLTFALGSTFFGERTAALAAVLLASTTVLSYEARQAKTDAVLLACIALAQFGLARCYLASAAGSPRAGGLAWWALWVGIAAGILVKGPIALLVAGSTALALSSWQRSARWLAITRPALGLGLVAVLVAPWLIAIALRTDNQFFAASLGQDFGAKIASGKESHAAPPGYYLVLFALCAWPASLFAPQALGAAWSGRADARLRFLIAWLVPSWLVFELVPTKLPHYVLPTYPAFALLAARGLELGVESARTWVARLWSLWWALFALALGVAFVAVERAQNQATGAAALLCAFAGAACAVLGVVATWRRARAGLCAALAAGAMLLYAAGYARVLPALRGVWIGPELASLAPPAERPVGFAGLNEPSLVFTFGVDTRFGDGAALADALASGAVRTAFVEKRQSEGFLARARHLGLALEMRGGLEAYHYSKGKPITLEGYALAR